MSALVRSCITEKNTDNNYCRTTVTTVNVSTPQSADSGITLDPSGTLPSFQAAAPGTVGPSDQNWSFGPPHNLSNMQAWHIFLSF